MPRIIKNGLVYTEGDYHNYSTDEQVVGTWIDGSTLYEKTINFGTLPDSALKSVNHLITNLNYVVDCFGFAENPTTIQKYKIPIPFTHRNSLAKNIQLEVTDDTIDIYTGENRTGYTICYVTLRYTKSSS